jgi:general secretion pathway protein K
MSAALQSPARVRRASDGFIVVAVLWILSALAVLVSIYAIYVTNTAKAVAVNDDTVVAEGLFAAGVELAAYQIISAPKDARPTRGQFALRIGMATVAVGFRSETARIDLNAAPKELVAGLFTVLGAQPEEAEQYAERITGWRTAPRAGSQDGEASLYRQAGLNYGPRGAPFAHVAELWLVLGLPPALVERALPHLTVFSGRPEINLRDAAPEVIAALPGLSPERLDRVLAQRGTAGQDGQTAPGGQAAPRGTTTEGSDATRVTVRVDFDNGRHLIAEAVILVRDFGEDPFRVLSWSGDIDAQLPELRPRAGVRR